MAIDDYRILSTPQVTINNQTLDIVPGSLKIKMGLGEQSVKVASAGGGSTSLVYSENVETKKGGVKFQLFTTPANIARIKPIKILNPNNAISITDPGATDTYYFSQATMINDPEINAQPDGVLDFEFEARSAV
jgi:hypothetical protein